VVKVRIKRLDHQMRGIGTIENKIVFVPKTLPEELVDINIVLEKKKFSEGALTKMLEKSSARKEPICPYFFECGGCQLLHVDYETSLNLKQEKVNDIINKNFQQKFEIKNIVSSDENLFYRNKITLQVNGTIGYFKEKTNSIIQVDCCYICDPKINFILNVIKDNMNINNVIQIIIRSSKNTGESMIIFKTSGPFDANKIISLLKDYVTSIYVDDTLVFGAEKITEILLGYKFYISPQSFFQVNTLQAEKLYQIALNYADMTKEDIVLDLYCGTGTIGLLASQNAEKVIGIELNKEAIRDANKNKELNRVTNINFYAGDVGKILNKSQYKPTIVIVDPPRAGLDSLAIEEIIKIMPETLVYVSCDLMTLVRDLNILSKYFNICELTPVDMFPQTSHVESVVLLKKK